MCGGYEQYKIIDDMFKGLGWQYSIFLFLSTKPVKRAKALVLQHQAISLIFRLALHRSHRTGQAY